LTAFLHLLKSELVIGRVYKYMCSPRLSDERSKHTWKRHLTRFGALRFDAPEMSTDRAGRNDPGSRIADRIIGLFDAVPWKGSTNRRITETIGARMKPAFVTRVLRLLNTQNGDPQPTLEVSMRRITPS